MLQNSTGILFWTLLTFEVIKKYWIFHLILIALIIFFKRQSDKPENSRLPIFGKLFIITFIILVLANCYFIYAVYSENNQPDLMKSNGSVLRY